MPWSAGRRGARRTAREAGLLELRLFGAFEVCIAGEPLPRLRSRAGLWLLALLALRRGQPVERAWLAATLWPDANDERGRFYLRRALTDLRRALGPEAVRLVTVNDPPHRHALVLDLSGGDARCDLLAFDAALEAGRWAEAAALYGGPLLEDVDEAWAILPRREAEERYLSVREALAREASAAGHPSEAAHHLRCVVAADPTRESAVRALMEAHIAAGDSAAAIQVYRDLRLCLLRERLGTPDAATESLYRRLREGAAAVADRPGPLSPAAKGVPAAGPVRLPAPLTRLIGREGEMGEVARRLARSRLVTLTGPGGAGKTRLAIAVAREAAAGFADGVGFADLAVLTDERLAPQVAARALLPAGAVPTEGADAEEDAWTALLRRHLSDRSALLVLDNCEHLLGACARLAGMLLSACEGLHVLATSRGALGVPGECIYTIPPLSDAAAAELFQERRPGAGGAPGPAVARIVRLLEGNPLAVEMAAGWAAALPLAEIETRLADRLSLHADIHGRGAVPRHRSLRATLDWSWDLLAPDERDLLAALSVFAGGWTLEAGEGAGGRGALASLVDRSLVAFDGERYRLAETIRQYAAERLREGATSEAILALRRRHRDHFLALAERCAGEWERADQRGALDTLEAERGNLRTALDLSRETGTAGDAEASLRLAAYLWRFYLLRGYGLEGRRRLREALADADATGVDSPRSRCLALYAAAQLAHGIGDLTAARSLLADALLAAERTGDDARRAACLGALGDVATSQGDFATATACLDEALGLNRALGAAGAVASNLTGLGYVHRMRGDLDAAHACLTEASDAFHAQGDTEGEANAVGSLAYVYVGRGDLAGARSRFERVLALHQRLGNRAGEAWSLCSLGELAGKQGAFEPARAQVEQALAVNRELGHPAGEAWNLLVLARILRQTGDAAGAEAALWQALELNRSLGNELQAAWALLELARTLRQRGDADRARCLALAAEAVAAFRSLGVEDGARQGLELAA